MFELLRQLVALFMPQPKLVTTELTPNFDRTEFDCRDGTIIPKKYLGNVQTLAEQLEVLRAELGGPSVKIMSGYRSKKYNRSVGGAKRSQHLTAKAADIQVEGAPPHMVHATIIKLIGDGRMQQGGLGLYNTFVHYDVRGRKARWSSL